METFKKIDFWISTGLIIFCTLVAVASWNFITLIYCYCVIGGWQVISMLVHMLNYWFVKRGSTRRRYQWISFGLLGAGVIGLIIKPVMLIIFPFLFFISPLLAVVYVAICFTELKELKLRHSLNLK